MRAARPPEKANDPMSSLAFEVVILFVLILANGVFAMSEAAVISARKTRLQQRANAGDAKARAALDLANEPSSFLATVQIGITLIGILAGAFGGATLAKHLAGVLREIDFLARYADALSLAIVVLIITYLSLIIGELVPKNLALSRPEDIAAAVAGPMSLLSRLTAPLVFTLSASTNLVLRLFGVTASAESPVTEEEINVMIGQGTDLGAYVETERDMVARIFHLADLRVGALMTPRTEIDWFDTSDSPDVIRSKLIASPHSHFPVASGDLDSIQGIVHAADVLERLLCNQPLDMGADLQRPLFVPETTLALSVFDMFKKTGTRIAVVIDEYGGVQGLVTLTDILEEVVGDVTVSQETIELQIVQRDDGSWLLDGLVSVQRLADLLHITALEENARYETLGGFVMSELERIPATGDSFEAFGYRFEVVDMDGHRVDKVLAMPAPLTAAPE